MSLGVLKFVLSRSTLRPISRLNLPLPTKPPTLRPACGCQIFLPWPRASFSTDTDGGDPAIQTDSQKKKNKKLDPRARVTISSVGRKIGQRHIHLIGADGEDLGVKHRADVIRLLDQTDLKLVAVNDSCDPPVYKLMKGKEIHEEQLKLREKQKDKKGVVQSKELNFSSDISLHDLDNKLRQIVSWLEKNNHVKLTIRAGTNSETPLDKILTQMVEKISVPVAFVSNPTLIRGGRASMCIFRLASAKEQQKKTLKKKADSVEEVQSDAAGGTEETKDLKQQ